MRPGKELKLNRPGNFEAALIQITGMGGSAPCSSCEAGLGPFAGCFSHPHIAKGVCGNCHYNSEGIRCLFRKLSIY